MAMSMMSPRYTLLPVNPAGSLMVEPLPRPRVRASEAVQKQFAAPDDSFRQNPNILEFEQLFDALWYPYIINPFKEDRAIPLSTDSRCTQGRPVRYSWAGESTVRSDAYTTDIVAAIAERFASEAANQEPMQGEIDSKHFRKYKSKLKAFLENKLNRLQEGKLAPGSEVIPVKQAKRTDRQVSEPIFEAFSQRLEA
ncbi:hypothetical protein [Bifidobacterium moukalabense]|uniref:hypothetical protein n=1 Tax=Bifidobacterium moukalabense TaxID=1333651 RepID=UPI0010F84FCD|nr:hypothetical protein [Bifidobacterium moukalabense]